MKYRIVLTVECEIDGKAKEREVREKLGDEILSAIPGVILDGPVAEDSPYAILIGAVTLESIKKQKE